MATLIVTFLVACGEQAPAPEPAPLVSTQKDVAFDAGLHASFAGEVRARSESALGFRMGGKVTERRVDVGASIKPCTLLARIDVRDLQLNSASLRSQLAVVQVDIVMAQANYMRYNDPYQINTLALPPSINAMPR